MRKLPIKGKVLTLEGDYEGWMVTVRTNPPVSVFSAIMLAAQNNDMAGLCEALMPTITAWDAVDEDGKAVPLTSDGLKGMPVDYLNQIVLGLTEAVSQPPNS